MLRYADKVFEHFNFSSGIGMITRKKRMQQLYISGKIKFSTVIFFIIVALIFTILKIATRIKMVCWNIYYFNDNFSINYKEVINI